MNIPLSPGWQATSRRGGHVQVDGCNFAQGPSGEALLTYLSQIWGVPVSGGREVQFAGTLGLEGTTVTASPDGRGGTALTEKRHPFMDTVLRGIEAVADAPTTITNEVGSLWDWVFGESD